MKRILRQFAGREANTGIQFIKYGIAGVVATVVDVGAFYLLSLTVIPALTADDTLLKLLDWGYNWLVAVWPALGETSWLYDLLHFDVVPISETVRKRHFVINRVLVFFISNSVAYVLNMLWVFKPGRHPRHREIALFFVVAVSSLVAGTFLGWALIHFAHLDTTQAFIGNIVAAVMMNFLCRKHFVFHG